MTLNDNIKCMLSDISDIIVKVTWQWLYHRHGREWQVWLCLKSVFEKCVWKVVWKVCLKNQRHVVDRSLSQPDVIKLQYISKCCQCQANLGFQCMCWWNAGVINCEQKLTLPQKASYKGIFRFFNMSRMILCNMLWRCKGLYLELQKVINHQWKRKFWYHKIFVANALKCITVFCFIFLPLMPLLFLNIFIFIFLNKNEHIKNGHLEHSHIKLAINNLSNKNLIHNVTCYHCPGDTSSVVKLHRGRRVKKAILIHCSSCKGHSTNSKQAKSHYFKQHNCWPSFRLTVSSP